LKSFRHFHLFNCGERILGGMSLSPLSPFLLVIFTPESAWALSTILHHQHLQFLHPFLRELFWRWRHVAVAIIPIFYSLSSLLSLAGLFLRYCIINISNSFIRELFLALEACRLTNFYSLSSLLSLPWLFLRFAYAS